MVTPRTSRRRTGGGRDGEPVAPNRKQGKELLIVGLIVGAVIAVVLVYFLSSGSKMSESDVADARATLRKVFETCIENRAADGIKLLHTREILRDETPDVKRWRELPAEDVKALEAMAFTLTKGKVIGKGGLELDGMKIADAIIEAAESKSYVNQKRVDFIWTWRGVQWIASLTKMEGPWLLLRLSMAGT